MKRFVKLLVAAATVGLGAASAAPSYVGSTPVVFVAVDSVEMTGGGFIVVTGVVEGDPAPSQWLLSFAYSSQVELIGLEGCHRAALVAMSRPGAYRLTLSDAGSSGYPGCALSLATP